MQSEAASAAGALRDGRFRHRAAFSRSGMWFREHGKGE